MGSIRLSMDILVGIRSDALLIFVGLCCISCLVLFLSFYRLPLISGRLLMAHRWARRTTLYMSLPSRSAIFCNMAICSTQRLLAPETFVLVELDRTGRIVNSYFIIFHALPMQIQSRAELFRIFSCLIAVAATIVYFHQFSGESGKKWILPAANFRAKKRLTLLNTLIICIRYCTVLYGI
jgi:hypothetical protein